MPKERKVKSRKKQVMGRATEGNIVCGGYADDLSLCSARKGIYYTVIEVKEHQALLSLYYSCYEASINPNNESFADHKRALDACNRFFEGGNLCLR